MKRKTDKSGGKTAWELAWGLRKYPAQLDEAKKMSKQDVIFCLLMWFGLAKVDAYQAAYNTRASRNSLAAMATRRSQEEWCYEYMARLNDLWYNDKLKFK